MKFSLAQLLLLSSASAIKLPGSSLFDSQLADMCHLEVKTSVSTGKPFDGNDASLLTTSSAIATQDSEYIEKSHCFLMKGENEDPKKKCAIASGVQYQIESKSGTLLM